MYYVYWIRRAGYDDVWNEGYVGISNNVDRRLTEHYDTSKKDTRLGRVLAKYDDVVCDVLHEVDIVEEALSIEAEYRPVRYVGWNVAPGGQIPPQDRDADYREKISDTHKKLGTVPYCEKTHSPEAIAKRVESMVGRKWFYCPETGSSGLYHEAPHGWLPGRKKVEDTSDYSKLNKHIKKNVKKWNITSPRGEQWEATDLRAFCEFHDIPYLAEKPGREWKGWKAVDGGRVERDYDYYYDIAKQFGEEYYIDPHKYATAMLKKQR